MREMTVLVAVLAIVATMGLGVLDAHAQTTPLPHQPQLPTQSRELSFDHRTGLTAAPDRASPASRVRCAARRGNNGQPWRYMA